LALHHIHDDAAGHSNLVEKINFPSRRISKGGASPHAAEALPVEQTFSQRRS
jgi:hypothetical protein